MDKLKITPETLAELRAHYDNADLSEEIARARWEHPAMVTTSLRLPADLLDWIREQAEQRRDIYRQLLPDQH